MKRIINTNKTSFSLKGLRIYILSGLCGVLALTSIFLTIGAASAGDEIASLQKTENQLLSQQQQLESSLVQNLSVNSLQEKSTELGFTKISTLVYVTGTATVARLPGSDIQQ